MFIHSITKQLSNAISADMMIYLPIKEIITKAARSRSISLLRVDKSRCLHH